MVESILVQLLLVLAIIVTNPLQTKQAEDQGVVLHLSEYQISKHNRERSYLILHTCPSISCIWLILIGMRLFTISNKEPVDQT
jgi:hypothetical protein